MLNKIPDFYEFKYSSVDSISEFYILISASSLSEAGRLYLERFPEDKFKFLSLRAI